MLWLQCFVDFSCGNAVFVNFFFAVLCFHAAVFAHVKIICDAGISFLAFLKSKFDLNVVDRCSFMTSR